MRLTTLLTDVTAKSPTDGDDCSIATEALLREETWLSWDSDFRKITMDLCELSRSDDSYIIWADMKCHGGVGSDPIQAISATKRKPHKSVELSVGRVFTDETDHGVRHLV